MNEELDAVVWTVAVLEERVRYLEETMPRLAAEIVDILLRLHRLEIPE